VRLVVDLLNWLNGGLVIILILYVFHHRILGAGEFQLGLLKLRTDIELSDPEHDRRIMKNLNAMIKGLDDWSAEKIDGRIENLEEFKKDWLTEILLDYPRFQVKLQDFCTPELIDDLFKIDKEKKGWDSVALLSNVIKKLRETFKTSESAFKLRYYNEKIRDGIRRNLGKKGILSAILTIAGSVVSIVITFL